MKIRKTITKSEMAYEAIKEAILNTEYKPGERIIIREVAEQIGTSDIPVREALNRLESENLVGMEPHVGYRVTKASDIKTLEKLEIKYELEAVAIRKTAGKITECEVTTAEKELKELKKVVDAKEYTKYFSKIREFNLRLYKIGGNDSLYDMLVTLFQATNSLGTIYTLVPGWCEYSYETHVELLELVRKGDGEGAYNLLRQFKFEGLNREMEGISKHETEVDIEKVLGDGLRNDVESHWKKDQKKSAEIQVKAV